MPSALIVIADGTEEMEFVITYDTLVRAGISVTSAYVAPDSSTEPSKPSPALVTCSRGVNILPDAYLRPLDFGPDKFDAIIVPGGAKGAETIAGNSLVQHLIREYYERDKVVGMICAGSLAALKSGLPKQPITSHPSVKNELEKDFEYREDSVVVSKNLVTSRGPGTAFAFAFTIVEILCGKDKREEVKGPMVFGADVPF